MSDLIEMMGGYGECERARNVRAASSFRIRGIAFTREELEREMLDYRRTNNMFEVYDTLIHVPTRELCTVPPQEFSENYLFATFLDGIDAIFKYAEFRHATDKELAAGFALPSRATFENEFKKTEWFKLHEESEESDKVGMFERHPEGGGYYSPLVALAWSFYELGAR